MNGRLIPAMVWMRSPHGPGRDHPLGVDHMQASTASSPALWISIRAMVTSSGGRGGTKSVILPAKARGGKGNPVGNIGLCFPSTHHCPAEIRRLQSARSGSSNSCRASHVCRCNLSSRFPTLAFMCAYWVVCVLGAGGWCGRLSLWDGCGAGGFG